MKVYIRLAPGGWRAGGGSCHSSLGVQAGLGVGRAAGLAEVGRKTEYRGGAGLSDPAARPQQHPSWWPPREAARAARSRSS